MTLPPSQTRLENAHAILAGAQEKIEKLRRINPYLIDLSLRENPVGARIGQTLADKLSILPRIRAFGFHNILLGTLDYAMPDEPEVDDDFMIYLRDHQIDMTGCFAFTDTGIAQADGTFTPSPSQLKLQAYGVPNTLHEIYLSQAGMAGQYDLETLRRSLPARIQWLNDNVCGDGGGKPRILINIVDGCDAFAEDPDTVCSILSLLAEQAIEGISIEDDRGTYLPLQVGAFVAVAPVFPAAAAENTGSYACRRRLRKCVRDRGAAQRRGWRMGRSAQARRGHRPRFTGRIDCQSGTPWQRPHAGRLPAGSVAAPGNPAAGTG